MSWFNVLSIFGLYKGGSPVPVDSTNRVPVEVKGLSTISAANSSTTALGAGATFTGAFEDISGYVSILVSLYSDSLAASGCLKFDFSSDGVNVDRTISVDMSTGGDFAATGYQARYVRIRVTAGGSAQTALRLQTAYSAITEGPKYVPLTDTLTDSSSALLTRGVIVGKTTGGGGGYVSVKVNPSGALAVDASNSTGLAGTFSQGAAGAATNRWPVKDQFTSIEYVTDQNGAGAVLSFTVSGAGDFLMVDVDNTSVSDYTTYRARATVDGSTPTATTGIVCRSGQTTYVPFPTTGTSIKVFAPSGTVVAVQLGHY